MEGEELRALVGIAPTSPAPAPDSPPASPPAL
jgi:hypothetical protein